MRNCLDTRTGVVHALYSEGYTNAGLRWSYCMQHHNYLIAMQETERLATCLTCLALRDCDVIGRLCDLEIIGEKLTLLVFDQAIIHGCRIVDSVIDVFVRPEAPFLVQHTTFDYSTMRIEMYASGPAPSGSRIVVQNCRFVASDVVSVITACEGVP